MPKAIAETPDLGALHRLSAASLDQMVPVLVSCTSAQRALAEESLPIPQLHTTWFPLHPSVPKTKLC